jgi:hypothetical protein
MHYANVNANYTAQTDLEVDIVLFDCLVGSLRQSLPSYSRYQHEESEIQPECGCFDANDLLQVTESDENGRLPEDARVASVGVGSQSVTHPVDDPVVTRSHPPRLRREETPALPQIAGHDLGAETATPLSLPEYNDSPVNGLADYFARLADHYEDDSYDASSALDNETASLPQRAVQTSPRTTGQDPRLL